MMILKGQQFRPWCLCLFKILRVHQIIHPVFECDFPKMTPALGELLDENAWIMKWNV